MAENNEKKKELKPDGRFVLKHVFENVSDLKEGDFVISNAEEHFNMRWFIVLKGQNGAYGFSGHCEHITPVGDKWSGGTKLNFYKNYKDYENAPKPAVNNYDDDVLWERLTYQTTDNNLYVEFGVKVSKMTGYGRKRLRMFDDSQRDVSDIVLRVRYMRFYVSKMYLAAQSSFFKTLFLEKPNENSESDMSEIPLTGIEPEDFQCFLELLYGESVIDESTVEGILNIADTYATPIVVKKCEEFLLEKSVKSTKKLLQMAGRYNLENLKKKCMSEIKTVADIRAVLPPDVKDLNPLIMAELFEKSLSLH